MSAAARETWFDRLTVPRTRRQVLRATLAGAALTLPFVRSATALGDDQAPCRKACNFHAVNRQLDLFEETCLPAYTKCSNAVTGGGVASAFVLGGQTLVWGPGGVIAAWKASDLADRLCLLGLNKCADILLLRQRAAQYQCLQPNCGTFDPGAKDGPCDKCKRIGARCCYDPKSADGITCCDSTCCTGESVGCTMKPTCEGP